MKQALRKNIMAIAQNDIESLLGNAARAPQRRILWVKVGGLWPLNTGGRLRSFHIIDELARTHRVTLLTTHGPADDPDGLKARLAHCERVVSLPYTAPKWNSPRFAAALVGSWFSRLPVDLWKYCVPQLREEADRLMAAHEIDLCVADFMTAIPNVSLDGPTPVVFFSHNVEYMIWKRLAETKTSWWQRPLLEIEWRKMQRIEAETCRRAGLTVAVSPNDRDLLAANADVAPGYAIPTGVDANYFAPDGGPESEHQLVFTGSMDWHPNDDAIRYFIESILPEIRREIPSVTLTVVGRNPSAGLKRVAQIAGVDVTGTVDDVRGYMSRAAVYVVPLRVGGGTRLKIFEALAMGKAVVSTTIGAEGLPLEDGTHFLCADRPHEFAQAVVSLLRDSARRRMLGRAGRQLVLDRYSWQRVASEFAERCEEVLAHASSPV
jgi:glycosyltransferase involved in cell wall biosynthesis